MRRLNVRLKLGAVAVMAGGILAACGDDPVSAFGPNPEDVEFASVLMVDLAQMTRLPTGTYIQDLSVGIGDTAVAGDTLRVHYDLWLADGTLLQTTRQAGLPFDFIVGVGAVISGWDDGVPGMIEGGLRKLVLPASRAYGQAGNPPTIPSDAVLIFDVELLDVVRDTTSSP